VKSRGEATAFAAMVIFHFRYIVSDEEILTAVSAKLMYHVCRFGVEMKLRLSQPVKCVSKWPVVRSH